MDSRNRSLGFPLLLVLGTLLGGCTKILGDTESSAACANHAQTYCEKLSTCSDGGSITRNYGDIETCVSRVQLGCTLELGAPDTGITNATLAACDAAYPGWSCADFDDDLNEPIACTPVGKKPSSAGCVFNAQCSSGYCNDSKTALCGTCGSAPTVGASCVQSFCAHGQSCAERTQTCTVAGSAGAACNTTDEPCAAGLACVGSTTTAPGTCMTAKTLGQACGGAVGACDGSIYLTCDGADSADKTCQPEAFGADGATCGTVPTGYASCAAGGGCYADAGGAPLNGETGTCLAPAADGTACDIEIGPPCLAPSRCVVVGGATAGICTQPTGDGCG